MDSENRMVQADHFYHLLEKARGSIGTRIIFSFFRFQPERRKAFRLISFPIT